MSGKSDDWDNPYRAPEVAFEPTSVSVPPGTGFFWVRLLLGLQVLIIVVSTGLAVLHTESIVGSGPVLSVSGILLAVVSLRRKLSLGVWTGAAAPAFSLFVFLTIFLNRWNPAEAREPVLIMGVVYAASLMVASVLLDRQLRAREHADELQKSSGNVRVDFENNSF